MKVRTARTLLAATIMTALASITASGPAIAAGGHDHGYDTPVLKLDAGSKWATDAPLRQGMLKIRTALADTLPAVHAGTVNNAQYQALGETVDTEIAYIVTHCKLAPDADAVLHGVIAALTEGAERVTGGKSAGERRAGVMHLVQALDDYGRYFAHPGWTPLGTGH